MQIWLSLSIVSYLVALLDASYDAGSPSQPTGTSRPMKQPNPNDPFELNINFTFPANGLPPLRLNLGNLAAFLTERDATGKSLGYVLSGQPTKKTVMVTIQNPNRPQTPIPAALFTAALPQGFQIPVNPPQVCRDFIVSKCGDICNVTRNLCRRTCSGRKVCLDMCHASQRSCTKFCDSTFTAELLDAGVGPTKDATTDLLPKCLRHCRRNKACASGCRDVCHAKLLAPAPLTDVLSTVPLSLADELSSAGKPSVANGNESEKGNDDEFFSDDDLMDLRGK